MKTFSKNVIAFFLLTIAAFFCFPGVIIAVCARLARITAITLLEVAEIFSNAAREISKPKKDDT